MFSYLKNHLIDDITSIPFPEVCFSCRTGEPISNPYLCLSCQIQLNIIENKNDVYAALIGKEYLSEPEGSVYSLLYYQKESVSQELLHQIKYHHKTKLAKYLGKKLAEVYKGDISEKDILIPVPLHPRKLRERGFNQATKIAEGISLATGARIRTDLLKRILYRSSQTDKSKKEREEVLYDTYRTIEGSERPSSAQRVIIVDDVITTGATIRACINQLKSIEINNYAVSSLAISL